MTKYMFLLIGYDSNGIHTETIAFAKGIADACVAFAKRNVGPIGCGNNELGKRSRGRRRQI